MVARRGADLLREARRRAGLSQRELAARAGVPQSTVSTYERGAREPTLPTLERLLRAAGFVLTTELVSVRADPVRSGRDLRDLLELVDRLPHRRRGELRYPRLESRAGSAS